MIEFKPITLQDKELITSYTFKYANYDCEYSFGNLICWHAATESSFALIDNYLVIRYSFNGKYTYLNILGSGDKTEIIRKLDGYSANEGQDLTFKCSQKEMIEAIKKYAPEKFSYHQKRNLYDYVYSRKALTELTGKNYQAKRNHINKFKKEYTYKYSPLTVDILPYCLQLEEEWCRKRNCDENDSMRFEYEALKTALNNFETLGAIGGAIWVNDKIVAFTLGTPINNECFDTMFEKADSDFEGAYNIINREFAASLPENYIYINREEDMGLEGLRKAKLSYHPVLMTEKCIVKKTND
ncbi:MAG: phosphatidylglycerol lysyltransferase domain-containing protein [Culturomica sp.]|jgi:hypothetical protein|nr:phosphatidylglycerol lysyltransferase domain-containing protein [Culturomica sp.]